MTAASRRSLGSVSVPVRRVVLSHPLTVIALVSHYLTNKLIVHRPLSKRRSFTPHNIVVGDTWGISPSFPELFPTWR